MSCILKYQYFTNAKTSTQDEKILTSTRNVKGLHNIFIILLQISLSPRKLSDNIL